MTKAPRPIRAAALTFAREQEVAGGPALLAKTEGWRLLEALDEALVRWRT
jgi:hypothetical protein